MIELAHQECRKRTPYTTSSGLQIGSHYEPPRKNHMSQEDECWQGVLLGEKPYPSANQVIVFVVYCIALAGVFALIAAAVGS
jgi:hypothetical protein